MTCCQWATVRFRHLCAHSKLRWQWLAVSRGFVVGSICPVTTGQESVVNRCATSPHHSVQISHPRRQGPSTQETILSDHPQQCMVLPRCCLSGSPWRLAWHQRSSGSMPIEYAVDGSTSQTHTGSNSTLLNALTASAKTSCLIPIGVGRGIVRTIRKTFEKICKYWFKVVTVWRLIWGNNHLYCGFRARRSHLTLHWMSAQGSVGFRCGTITGPYLANFSQVETQKFNPLWFYYLQWGCNNRFCQECISCDIPVRLPCIFPRAPLKINGASGSVWRSLTDVLVVCVHWSHWSVSGGSVVKDGAVGCHTDTDNDSAALAWYPRHVIYEIQHKSCWWPDACWPAGYMLQSWWHRLAPMALSFCWSVTWLMCAPESRVLSLMTANNIKLTA